jgi:ParB/Sulfiredoxin domain
MALQSMGICELKPYHRNARTHSKTQIKQIAKSIERFGFTNPVLISDDNEIIAGHGRVLAAQLLGHSTVPTLRLSHLGPAERRAYILADNKLAQNAGWDRELLAIELQGLINLDFEVELTGFALGEIDIILDDAQQSATTGGDSEDDIPTLSDQPAVVRPGEVWRLGRHRLICGDARERPVMEALMEDERAHLIFTDPPYNVRSMAM